MLNKKVFTPHIRKAATRDGFGEGLLEAGEKDEDVVTLTADLKKSTRAHLFAERFPHRFFEVGVAEQNLAGISAGLALNGKIPFMTSYSVFSPGRNWDQIRVSICYSEANVKIVSSHAGLATGPDGATHQALEDIALTRVLPNLVVLSPADKHEAKKATLAAAEHEGPVYIRLVREKTPIFTTERTHFEIGEASILQKGSDLTIIATGPIVYEALSAANELKNEKEIHCDVINCSTIKPLDKKTIMESVKKTGKVLTVEEHQVNGGMGSAVSELVSQNHPVKMKIMGVKDTFTESGDYFELKDKYEVSKHHIKENILQMIEKS